MLRLLFWNVVGLLAGLLFVGLVGEAWIRLTKPFMYEQATWVFVPEVGRMLAPGSRVRSTNKRDFWTVSHTNSWGMLDREPLPPERAAASCHVALIGDSYLEAKQVPIADKVQVRLEALARQSLPHLDVTVSAFGIGGTAQIGQLPLYDVYARRLRPKLVVLFFHPNDFPENVQHRWVRAGHDPYLAPWLSVARGADGTFEFVPPSPDYGKGSLAWPLWDQPMRHLSWLTKLSWFYQWATLPFLNRRLSDAEYEEYVNTLMARGRPRPDDSRHHAMAFALDEFKARAARDGAALVVFANHDHGRKGPRRFDKVVALAEPRDIPVVDLYEYIVRQGGSPADATWPFDRHWNPAGHQWAAEALFEWLAARQEICAHREPQLSAH